MLRIVEDDLSGPEIAALLQRHLDGMLENSPPESVYALDLDALRAPDIRFWSARAGGALAGCGALRRLDATHGEIKSMRTADAFLGRGVGTAILRHILSEAKTAGLTRLSLETGPTAGFAAARRLYERHGFVECGAFASYRADDPFSRFFTRDL